MLIKLKGDDSYFINIYAILILFINISVDTEKSKINVLKNLITIIN